MTLKVLRSFILGNSKSTLEDKIAELVSTECPNIYNNYKNKIKFKTSVSHMTVFGFKSIYRKLSSYLKKKKQSDISLLDLK